MVTESGLKSGKTGPEEYKNLCFVLFKSANAPCKEILHEFSVLFRSKLNMFGFWTVGQTK